FVSEQTVIAAPFGREVRFGGGGRKRAEVEEVIARAASVIEPEFAARFVGPEPRAEFPGPVEARRSQRPRIEFVAFEFSPRGGSELEAEAESRAMVESADQSVDVVNHLDGRCVVLLRRVAFARERPAHELRGSPLRAGRSGQAGSG